MGPGAVLGPLRGETYGIGPAVSYSTRINGRPLSISFRHFQEFGVANRFEGHITTLSLATRF